MATLFNEVFNAIRGRCISDELASVAAAEVAELVVKKFTSTNSAMDAICTCGKAVCRYRSATEPNICLDPTELCKFKQHQ